MHRTRHKHVQRSYLSDGIGGDSQSLLERESLRSKDKGLLSDSYNTDVMMDRKISRKLKGKVLGCDVVPAITYGDGSSVHSVLSNIDQKYTRKTG